MNASKSIAGGDGLYERFKPQERFQLVLEAMARKDEAEADRLLYSCPRKSYTGPDAAFDDRLTMGFEMICLICADLRHRIGALRVLLWAMAMFERFAPLHHINTSMAFVEGMRCGQGLPQAPFFIRRKGEPHTNDHREEGAATPSDCGERMDAVEQEAERTTELIVKVLARTGTDIAAELICLWHAIGEFSRSRLGLSPETALDAVGFPNKEDLTDALKLYAHLKPDPEVTAEYLDIICGLWDRRFGGER